MNSIIQFPNSDVKEYRKKCCFMNRAVQVAGEDGELHKYPCIVLYEEETGIPIFYTGLERYLCQLVKSEILNGKALAAKAYAVCHLLNYILKETDINSVHECTLETVRNFLKFRKTQDNGTEYNKGTWLRYRDYVVDFLLMYYDYNRDKLPFQYIGEELKSLTIVKDEGSHKKATIVHNVSLHISAPKTTHKKNRILVDGYLDLLLYEAKKYEPDIAIGIALGAYAGLREGEVVNVTCGGVQTLRKTFGMVSGIEIDLTEIEEINNSRSLTASINTNLLLRASNIDTFIEQPDLVKRKMIVETRETVDKLLIRNGNLTRENEALKSENKSIKSEILKMTDKVAVLKKTQDKLIKQVTYLMKTTDEAKRKEILSQMGIEDGFVDLNIYSENLQQELLEVMDINKSLRKYLSGGDEIQSIEKKQISIKDDIMSGLDF